MRYAAVGAAVVGAAALMVVTGKVKRLEFSLGEKADEHLVRHLRNRLDNQPCMTGCVFSPNEQPAAAA